MEFHPSYEVAALSAEEIRERWWLAFTPEHDPLDAAERFARKAGAPPGYLVRTPTMLLVGPLPRNAGTRGGSERLVQLLLFGDAV